MFPKCPTFPTFFVEKSGTLWGHGQYPSPGCPGQGFFLLLRSRPDRDLELGDRGWDLRRPRKVPDNPGSSYFGPYTANGEIITYLDPLARALPWSLSPGMMLQQFLSFQYSALFLWL